jgi:hypothetical protein
MSIGIRGLVIRPCRPGRKVLADGHEGLPASLPFDPVLLEIFPARLTNHPAHLGNLLTRLNMAPAHLGTLPVRFGILMEWIFIGQKHLRNQPARLRSEM